MEKENDLSLMNYYYYFKMLYNINVALTTIMDGDSTRSIYENEELFYIISSEMLRLLPYSYSKVEDKFELDCKCGILLLPQTKMFVQEKYNKIICFEPLYKILKDILKIRNKFMHEPHNISCAFSIGGFSNCSMGLYYKKNLLSISTISLMPIVYYLNKVFSEIKKKIIESDKNIMDCHNYAEFMKFDFSKEKWHYTLLPEFMMLNF